MSLMDIKEFKWTREPQEYKIENDRIEITTSPHTDLWQRTYYHFKMITPLSCRWKQKKNISVL